MGCLHAPFDPTPVVLAGVAWWCLQGGVGHMLIQEDSAGEQ